jgi:hypothetical protein
MIKKTYPWIIIDKANMSKVDHHCNSAAQVAMAMMKGKKGTFSLAFRDFSQFVVIKDEEKVIDLVTLTKGLGGDSLSIYHKVKAILEQA